MWNREEDTGRRRRATQDVQRYLVIAAVVIGILVLAFIVARWLRRTRDSGALVRKVAHKASKPNVQKGKHPTFSKMSTQELIDFINQRSRTAEPTAPRSVECDEACLELALREGGVENLTPSSLTCKSTYCAGMGDIRPKCSACSLAFPSNCEEDEMMRELEKCTDPADTTCLNACSYTLAKQNRVDTSEDWALFCESSYCAMTAEARSSTNYGSSGYCCLDEHFPNVKYCKDNNAMTALIDSNCPEHADCQAACEETAQYNGGAEWDPHGDNTQSSGACKAGYCYNNNKAEGGSCYICSVTDNVLCSNEALLAEIQKDCD